jgi:hypothetical protein
MIGEYRQERLKKEEENNSKNSEKLEW